MLIVNALRYAEHSRAGHDIAGRTNHRFVRYITASTTCKIVVRHWRLEPSTTLITDFTGIWKSDSLDLESFVVVGASGCNKTYSYATCPAGNKLLSGGYSLTYFSGNASNAYNAPDGSFPDVANNRWVVTGAGSNNNCFAAYAMCSR